MDWTAIALSLRLATMVSAALLVIGLPIAYWLTFSTWRWKFLVESIVALPLVLPPTVLGFYVLVALGSRSPIGRAWTAWTGHGLAFSFEGLVIASILYSLPFAVQPIVSSFAQIDRTLFEASAILGASRSRTFWRIVVPLSLPGIVAGWC
jgi:molybdate transport system permease protein